jgi:alkylhydroperoxidase family enzyme
MHTETARLESGGAVDVEDPGSLRPEVAAVLPLLEKVTRTPERVTATDVREARAAGVPVEAIVDALHVSLIFNTINRLANAFDLAWDCDEQVRIGAKVIHRINYRLPRVLTR